MTEPQHTLAGASALPHELPAATLQGPRYRSGAVARMAGIPVSTLRIWERRYQVAAPPLTASGHRLYSAHDVQRLALMKRLIGLGHAIGTIAGLDLGALEQLAAARAGVENAAAAPARAAGRMSVAVIGNALAQRLSSVVAAASAAAGGPRGAALAARLKVVTVSADLLSAEAGAHGLNADLLLVQLSTLHTESADRVLALARRVAARQVIVLYAFGPERAVQTLRVAGAVARREPVSNHDLAALLTASDSAHDPSDDPGPGPAASALAMALALANTSVAPRRFSDEALVQIAAMSTTVACECPRHVAELVGQLASFETYCAECLNTGPDDAALHADLNRVAASARAMFEAALVRVAQAEGFNLPA